MDNDEFIFSRTESAEHGCDATQNAPLPMEASKREQDACKTITPGPHFAIWADSFHFVPNNDTV